MTRNKNLTSHKRHLTFTEKLEAWLYKHGISSPLLDLSIWNSSGTFAGFGHYEDSSCKFFTKNENGTRKLIVYSDNGILLKEVIY